MLVAGGASLGAAAMTGCSTTFLGGLAPGSIFSGPANIIRGAVATGDGFALSPDGNLIAFQAMIVNGSSSQDLYVYNRQTRKCVRYNFREDNQPVQTRYVLASPSFSPDGRSLAVSARRAKASSIFPRETRPNGVEFADIAVFDIAGGRAKRFGDRRYFHTHPAFSHSGDKIVCVRPRDPLKVGWHVDDLPSYNALYHEIDLVDGAERAFASVRFPYGARPFYDADEKSILVTSQAPLDSDEVSVGIGVPEIWRIPRGSIKRDITSPEFAIDFSGPRMDRIIGVGHDGSIYIASFVLAKSGPPTKTSIYRILGDRQEVVLTFAGGGNIHDMAISPITCAWHVYAPVAPGVVTASIRIVGVSSDETIDLNAMLASVTDLTIST